MPSIKKYSLLKWTLIVLLPLNLFSYLLLKEFHQSYIHFVFSSNKEHKELLTLCFSTKTLLTINWIEAHEFVLYLTSYNGSHDRHLRPNLLSNQILKCFVCWMPSRKLHKGNRQQFVRRSSLDRYTTFRQKVNSQDYISQYFFSLLTKNWVSF